MMSGAVTVEAPAKVNLWLKVLGRETSGYHSLETLFCAIDLCDRIHVEAAPDGVALEVQGETDTGPVEENLVVRAARRFLHAVGRGGVRIRLEKRIPSAAGLGGGSSDAAATLRALNHLAREPLGEAQLLQMAIELGSDVPFFLSGSPLALGWGRGERLLSLPPLPERSLLIVHPGAAMATAAAFQALARHRGGDYQPSAQRYLLQQLTSWNEVAQFSVNDFEAVVPATVPAAAEAISLLRHHGAAISRLAGSGACVFGVFADDTAVELAEVTLRERGFAVWRARTLAAIPAVSEVRPQTGAPGPPG